MSQHAKVFDYTSTNIEQVESTTEPTVRANRPMDNPWSSRVRSRRAHRQWRDSLTMENNTTDSKSSREEGSLGTDPVITSRSSGYRA